MRFTPRSRSLAGAVAASLLGLAGLTTVAPQVGAAPPDVVRVEGATRYGTAAAAATRAYPDGASTVVITTGEKFPDALAANGLAGANSAPILLTARESLSTETATALRTLDPTSVVIVGGHAAVSRSVEDALAADHDVRRVAGADRFATAAEVATTIGAAPAIDAGLGAGPLATAFVANGLNFPDAVAASPALHQREIPLLLTPRDSLGADAVAAIGALGVEQVVVLGGSAAVSDGVEDVLDGLGLNVVRLAGATRFETAVEVARFELDRLGFSPAITHLATGAKFPDALAGGPLASVNDGPLVLTGSLPVATEAFLRDHAADIDELIVLGGAAAIDEETVDAARAAADPDNNQAFTVSPETATTLTVVPNPEGTADTSDDRQYTVAGLDDVSYHLQLVPAGNVTVSGATVSFGDADDDGVADEGTVAADITRVNGTAVASPGPDAAASPVDGRITFTVDGDTPEAVRPVVFSTADGDEDLDLDAQGEPTDAFGLGGAITYRAPSGDGSPVEDGSPGEPEDAAATANSDSQITLTWSDPATGSPDSFRIHRNDEACTATTLAELTAVGSVAGSAGNQFVDTGLAANTPHCYAVTAVAGSGESTLDATDDPGDSVAGATTATDGLRSTDVRLVTDAGTTGRADTGDVWRIVFDSAVNVTDGDSVRVEDGHGEFNDVVLDNSDALSGDEADWSLNQSPVIVGATTYPTRTILTITIEELLAVEGDADADASDNNGVLDYPLTITGQTGIEDDQGDAWTPSNDPDNVSDDEGAQTVTQIAPFVTAGDITVEGTATNVWSEVGDVLSITFSEPVHYVGPDADGAAGTQVSEAVLGAILGTDAAQYAAASVVTVDGSGTGTLTFTISGAMLDASIGEGTVIDGTANANIQDLDGVDQIVNPDDDPRVTVD